MNFKSLMLASFVSVALISSNIAFSGVQECGLQSQKTGQIYKVNGSDNNLMSAPGGSGKKLINEKATAALGKTRYLTIDNSTTVKEECNESGWSKVGVIDPEWLKSSHIGWVPSNVLRGQKKNSAGQEEFTEADFMWDKNTTPHKKTIIAGVNKVHKENVNCKKIDPYSAYLSSSKGTAADPVFYVTCGEGVNSFNAFFSKSEVDKNKKLSAIKHIDKNTVIQNCEEYAKNNATHPSTVDFSRIMDLVVVEHPNGNTTVTSSFTAKNSFNLELKYNIRCLSNAGGLFEASINEAK
jgi:hypothetical protein